MMSSEFVDWWFAPWTYASDIAPLMPGSDQLSRRDGYREWCAEARVTSDLPLHYDPLWSSAAVIDSAVLQQAATLFMGLIMARQRDQSALAELPFADRKWCLTIAATQPLHAYAVDHPDSSDTLPQRGLAELAIRLEQGFPGMWPRLQLTLPTASRAAVALRLQNSWADQTVVAQSASRSQRCWRLCRQRSEVSQ